MNSTPTTPADGFTYYAFVSYNWRDARWAKWIQRSLEHYRLPSIARREVGHEARIRPVFRFETDLGAADLRRDLHKELDQSRYLVVVCSPNSAFPNVKGEHWVNDEIAHFVEMGRTDRIVPVIVGGNPDSDGPDRCFPPALAQAKIAGISVRKEGRGQALQKIVAKLLGLRPDILIDRWHRDLLKKRLFSAFCVLPAVLLAALGGLFAWDASRDVTADYADYTESFGLPRGIFRLSPGEISGRDCLYRFHWQGFRHGNSPHLPSENEPPSLFAPLGFRRVLRRVEQTGSVGHPKRLEHTEFAGRSPVMEFSYDGNRLAEIRHCEFVGIGLPPRLVKRELFSDEPGDPFPNGLVEFKGEKNSTFLGQLAHATSMKGNPADFHVDLEGSGRSRIAKHRILRDGQGRPAHVSFLDAEGMPLSDADGIWGFDFLYDDWGRVTEWWYFGQDDRRAGNRTGVAGRLYRYENRHLQFVYYVDRNRQPHPSHQGWAVCRIWADSLDRAAKIRYYDAENQPALSLETDIAGFDMAYDAQGLRTNVLYVGLDGKPTLNRKALFPSLLAGNYDDETHIAGFRSQFDAMGNETNRAFFGLDGAPALCEDGIAGYACDFDARGNMTRQLNFGLDGLPAPNREDGVAGYAVAYDARGFPTNVVCLGTNGLPSLSNHKYSRLRLGFDDQRNLTFCLALDVDGSPCPFDGTDVAGMRIARDSFGNPTNLMRFGVDGQPCLDAEGIAGIQSEFDARGRETRRTFLGTNGTPVLFKGVAGYNSEVQEHGRLEKIVYFGLQGEKTSSDDGIAGHVAELDGEGRETTRRFLALDGTPATRCDGVLWWTNTYGNGVLVQRDLFAPDGQGGVLDNPRIHHALTRFDKDEHVIEEQYFGIDGNPVATSNGVSRCVMGYADGILAWRDCFAPDGQNGPLGEVNAHHAHQRYDKDGNLIEERYFGIDGEPVAGINGISRCVMGYADGILSWMDFFAPDGQTGPLGEVNAHHVHQQYDKDGNVIEELCFDANGNPVGDADGVARRVNVYSNGVLSQKDLYAPPDSQGLVPGLGNAEHLLQRFDPDGNITEIALFDAKGNPVPFTNGVFRTELAYSEGRLVQQVFHAPDGQTGARGIANANQVLLRFDREGNATEELYFDANGDPVADARGIARTENEYANGVLVQKVFSSPPGQGGCMGSANAQRAVVRLDSNQHPVGTELYDPDGRLLRPVCGPIGADSAAAQAGVQTGDVVLQYGRYRLDDPESVASFLTEVQALKATNRTLLVARRSEERWVPLSFVFSKGDMGIFMEYTFIGQEDMDALQPLAKQADMEDCGK